MKTFVITANENPEVFKDVTHKGVEEKYVFDFTPWCEDNESIIGASWETDSGTAGIINPQNDSNVLSATLSFQDSGSNLIKVTAATGTSTYVANLEVTAKDPHYNPDDYGFCS